MTDSLLGNEAWMRLAGDSGDLPLNFIPIANIDSSDISRGETGKFYIEHVDIS